MRKKFVCMICSIVLSLSVVGCGSQKKDNISSKAENTVSEKEVSNVSEVTAESSVEEEIDPQLKADFEYLVQYYTKTVDILKVLVSDSSKKMTLRYRQNIKRSAIILSKLMLPKTS